MGDFCRLRLVSQRRFGWPNNPASIAGLGSGRPVIPVFVLDEETSAIRLRSAASRWWLHHSLRALDASLRSLGSR